MGWNINCDTYIMVDILRNYVDGNVHLGYQSWIALMLYHWKRTVISESFTYGNVRQNTKFRKLWQTVHAFSRLILSVICSCAGTQMFISFSPVAVVCMHAHMCVCMQFPALGDIPILIKYFLLSSLSSYVDEVFRQHDWNMPHYLHVCACILKLLKPSVILHCCNILFLWHCMLWLIHAKNEFMNKLCIHM